MSIKTIRFDLKKKKKKKLVSKSIVALKKFKGKKTTRF